MAVESTDFNSSMLAGGAFDDDKREMSLTFQDGSQYVYRNVPPELWAAMKAAPSPGSFYNANIKGQFS